MSAAPPAHRGGQGWARRLVAAATATALGTGALVAVAAAPASAAERTVADARLTWGLSGYAQKGIFGAWTFKDLTGDVAQLVGSVSGGTQDEYLVDPVPVTSFPADKAGQTPNAVQFSDGTGTADPATGAAHLSWSGSYTVNAYPAQFNAPNEVYADPQLEVGADGSGELTFEFALGAGVDISGNPTPAQDFGRLTVLTFSAGSVDVQADGTIRLSPDYQGVTVDAAVASQTTSCTTDGGATGWWGAWSPELVAAVPASVRPHFYSSGCGGMQDNKPALPVDVDVTFPGPGTVVVSDTTLASDGTTTVTVEGTGFDPTLATATRPPFAGQQAGAYIAFGRYVEQWRPSQGAPSSVRTNPSGANGTGVSVIWAVPAASFAASSPVQDPDAAAYTELRPDGSFTATVQVDPAWLADKAGRYGIYTYAGGGATVADYETFTPLTFHDRVDSALVAADATGVVGRAVQLPVQVTAPGEIPTGTVTADVAGTPVASATLVDGRATLALGGLAAGAHTVQLAFVPDGDTVRASSTTTVVTVARGTAKVAATWPALTFGTQSTVAVVVTGPVPATGKVTLTNGSTTLATATLTPAGRAQLTVPRTLAAGARTLTVRYAGSTELAPVAVSARRTVAKAASTTRATAARVKATARGKVVVRVSATGTVPTGAVKAVVKRGGVKKATVTGSLTRGARTLALPRLPKGTYTVVVTYAGSANVKASTRTLTFTVV